MPTRPAPDPESTANLQGRRQRREGYKRLARGASVHERLFRESGERAAAMAALAAQRQQESRQPQVAGEAGLEGLDLSDVIASRSYLHFLNVGPNGAKVGKFWGFVCICVYFM